MPGTTVILLGTGTPAFTPGRHQSSVAIMVDDQTYIIDCGSGCMERIVQAREQGHQSLRFQSLDKLFITHFHPDHTTGLPSFILGPWVRGRKQLGIWGPAGTAKMIDGLLTSYQPGIEEHLHHGPFKLDPPLVKVNQVTEGVTYQDGAVEVEAVRVDHGNLETYAYIFNTPDKKIVISGDTRPVEKLYQKAMGCDLLIHEVYSEDEVAKFPPRSREYFQKVHTGGYQLGKIAQNVKPGLLVLTHQMRYSDDLNGLLGEIRENYAGEVIFGNDLDSF